MKVRSTKTLAEAIYEATYGKSGAELSRSLTNAVEFMDKHQLLGKKNEILNHLERIIDANENILRAKVTSSAVLSKKMLEDLEENLKKRYKVKEVEIDEKLNEDLISGIKIEAEGEIIDLSMRHQLHQLQNHLIKN